MKITNALTIDVEDWYQVANLEHLIPACNWPECEDRLESSVDRLLALLRLNNVRATFFVLGWNAVRHPELVHRIASEGHELGTHGFSHKLIYNQSKEEFSRELEASIRAISSITGKKVIGHRAASFSITERSSWAVDVLAQNGIEYDSSIVPTKHSRYGIPQSSRVPYLLKSGAATIVEFPVSTLAILGRGLPFSGGAYFRFLPYRLIKASIQFFNAQEVPIMFYLHPWELDAEQPRMPLNAGLRLRCYYNIENMEAKLARMLGDFAFGPAADVVASVRASKLSMADTTWLTGKRFDF